MRSINLKIIERGKRYEIEEKELTYLISRIHWLEKINKHAIEYLKSHSNNCMFELRMEEMEELLDILKGSDKE